MCLVWNGSAPAQEVPAQPAPVAVANVTAANNAANAPAVNLPVESPRQIPMISIFGIFTKGGIVMFPIVGASFLLLVFVFERALMLRWSRVIPGPFVKRFLHRLKEGTLDREQAIELCRTNPNPVAGVFEHAVRKWGKPAVEVEQAVLDGGERVVNHLRRHLRIISGIATISPLLGLLGTVTGMISTFNTIAGGQAMGRPEMLAAGIGEALLTTAAGLCVAIPALIFHMLLTGRVDRLTMELDALGLEVVHLISAESLQPTVKPRGPKRASAVAPAATSAA